MTWSRCPLPPLPVSVMNNVWGLTPALRGGTAWLKGDWDGIGGEGVASGQGRRQPRGLGPEPDRQRDVTPEPDSLHWGSLCTGCV